MTRNVGGFGWLRRWLVRVAEWLFLWALLMLIVGVFQMTHDHFRAQCEAQRVEMLRMQIHDGYEVPSCFWNWDTSEVVMDQATTPPMTSRYPAIDWMLSVK